MPESLLGRLGRSVPSADLTYVCGGTANGPAALIDVPAQRVAERGADPSGDGDVYVHALHVVPR